LQLLHIWGGREGGVYARTGRGDGRGKRKNYEMIDGGGKTINTVNEKL